MTAEGLTHASSVIAELRRREAVSGIVTRELVPLKLSALPYLPELDQVVLTAVPELLFPEASVIVIPDPSSNAYAATRPGVLEFPFGVATRTPSTAAATARPSTRAGFRARPA